MNVLDIGGFKVVHIPLPNRIASIRAIANATGSLFEQSEAHQGAAHFMEHMFFKGTARRSYSEVALLLDGLGDHNASTSYNDTKFYINCRTGKWTQSLSFLCELLFENNLDEDEFYKEKAVILEELGMRDDDPVMFFMDRFVSGSYNISSVGGSLETVANMSLQQLSEHLRLYDQSNVFFVVAGNITEQEVAQECTGILGHYKIKPGVVRARKNLKLNQEKLVMRHPTGQGIFAIALEGFDEDESVQHNLVDMLFSHGFGGISSSCLYERIRQELGLCYQVSNDSREIGERELNISWGVTSPKNLGKAMDEVWNVLEQVRKNGFGDRLPVYQENLCHHIDGIAERSSACASVFGDTLMSKKHRLSADAMVTMLNRLTNNDIAEYARVLGTRGTKIVVMGE